ncbi:cupin domain-containing protein [Streptomyces sp. FIT100]|uniref:cupin domain-containing protein n=1 Tax=Streptomyces sp. FIT100 TaxID=2837956 RepID=UPI0021C897CA|nr:cupin domain-containing protein [Streptomyces sp. FIT100]UUN26602.1 cupin [Streptomyces sp. FIT100]
MEHRLVSAIETALDWSGPEKIGTAFALGRVDDAQLLARLLTPNRLLDIAMRRSLCRPQFRAFQNGEEVHPAVYFSDTVSPRGQAIPMVNMHRLGDLLRDGATLIMDQLNTFDPTMEAACRALQWWTHERVQVNTYLTTNEASGFPLHWDDHDVIVVQLAGEKEWEVRDTSRAAPMYRDADPNNTPSDTVIFDGTLQAGDVMHIPRGHWHHASRTGSGSGFSLHATFGVTKRTGASWMAWLGDWCREREVFRHDLDRSQPDSEALVDAAARLVRDRGPADFLVAYEQQTNPGRHVPFLDIFGPLDAVVCTAHFPPQINESGEAVDVVTSGKRLTLAAEALPALRLLLSGHPVPLGEAAATIGDDVHEVAEILVKEEICTPLNAELSSGYTGLVTTVTS